MIQFWRRIKPKAYHLTAFFFLFVFCISSCKKHSDEIGYNLLTNYSSQVEGIVVDSFEVITYTISEDSIPVDSLGSAILGAINDPTFGTSNSSLYLQCLLEEINIDFGTTPVLDSIVLTLLIDDEDEPYGNVNSEVQIDVFRMAEILERENKYYSNYKPAIGDKIGTWAGNLNPEDTAWFYDDGVLKSTKGLLRIPLDQTFGEQFFTANAYGSNESFLSFLNGVALIPNAGILASEDGSIVPLDLNSVDSRLILYFSDSLKKEFVITDQSERMMHYEITGRQADIIDQLDNPGIHNDVTFLQSMASVKTRIEIPELLDLTKKEGKVLINEAWLTLTIKDGTTSDNYPAPDRLLLFQPSNNDGTGANSLIQDLRDAIAPPNTAWIGFTNYGGELSGDGKTYSFRLNRHVQEVLDSYLNTGEEINRGFYLIIPSANPITPSRLVLDTKNGPNIQNIRLKITYTKL